MCPESDLTVDEGKGMLDPFWQRLKGTAGERLKNKNKRQSAVLTFLLYNPGRDNICGVDRSAKNGLQHDTQQSTIGCPLVTFIVPENQTNKKSKSLIPMTQTLTVSRFECTKYRVVDSSYKKILSEYTLAATHCDVSEHSSQSACPQDTSARDAAHDMMGDGLD